MPMVDAQSGECVQIVTIKPAGKKTGWVRVGFSDGRKIELTEARCVELGIRVGTLWNDDRHDQAVHAAAVDALKKRALRLLERRPYSRQQLDEKLQADQPDSSLVKQALDELARAGIIDDRVFATALVESALARGPGQRHLVERKLALAGVAHNIVAEVIAELCPDEPDDARALVERQLEKADPKAPRVKVAARIARHLASRGFDEYTARDAIESVMGSLEHEAFDL